MNENKNKDTKTQKKPWTNVDNLMMAEDIAKECGINLRTLYEDDIKFTGFNLETWYVYFQEPALNANEKERNNRSTFRKEFPEAVGKTSNILLDKCDYKDLFTEVNDGNTCAKIRLCFSELLKEIEALKINKDKYDGVIENWKNNDFTATDASFMNFDFKIVKELFEVYNCIIKNYKDTN